MSQGPDDDDLPTAPPPQAARRAGSGVFRRWGGVSFSMFEELFGPTHKAAREQIEEQKRIGNQSTAPTDPLELDTSGSSATADGHRRRFTGRITLRRP